MVGAWWAAARAVPPVVPLVASEHNQMSWPGRDYTAQARKAAHRVDLLFTHGPAVGAWAAGLGLGGRPAPRAVVGGGHVRPAISGTCLAADTFTGRFRDDKAPDVLVEALALLDAAPGRVPGRRRPHAPGADPAHPGSRAGRRGAPSGLVLPPGPLRVRG